MSKAIRPKGTVSGEHGIEPGKKGFLSKELSPATIGVFKAIKESLDPHCHKIFD